ncbi:MAG TPA: class I SAM-dependent methyltransferase [Candidatus Latescibacteria bacterium]|nr:SAM-dependent methyltransferase [Gemmatimonadaceae bacterium]MDP6016192.1 class I SAM-dependent methyltransferase [Candidatus Latescibacterota bacterium]HJP29879.1 class I SAM-dependent methyltransferase [Candidatus Latescibacterota bacterium]
MSRDETQVTDSPRLQREAEFHDEAFSGDARRAAGKYYATARGAKACYHQQIRSDGADRAVLEYGCGKGSAAFELATHGARVTGIDISQVGISEAQDQGQALGLSERLSFLQMNAEILDFDDGSFDLVCGSGILHHLDLARAIPEVVRVLRPGGRAVFFEPLGHNPLINLYRRLTPAMRSADEHPLSMADIDRITAAFDEAQSAYFGLFTLLAAPARPGPGSALLHLLESVDRAVLRIPMLQRYAWIVVTRMTKG